MWMFFSDAAHDFDSILYDIGSLDIVDDLGQLPNSLFCWSQAAVALLRDLHGKPSGSRNRSFYAGAA